MHLELYQLLSHTPSFATLLAPTGWGKTTLLIKLHEQNYNKILYFSPLRALAQEFAERVDGICIAKKAEFKQKYEEFNKKQRAILICTPEVFDFDAFQECDSNVLIVLDELHLFYRWGYSFRPYLEEFLYALSTTQSSVLGLTATLEDDLIYEWKNYLGSPFKHLYLINVGNLIVSPLLSKKVFYFPILKKKFVKKFLRELKKKQTLLYFCRYRQEVYDWVNFCHDRGLTALGCVGGEALKFREQLKKTPNPHCIFATSTLSHGVNLPDPSKIFISYPVKEKDFWVQMLGRGGRRGQTFELHTFDDFDISYGQKLLDSLKHLLGL
ncbi:MAG: DEAD/DEAH box helicase [Bdellovibrionales bacterium]|nr:DEAD/DEAH box helicase [Bdellovibrionales bacterium]